MPSKMFNPSFTNPLPLYFHRDPAIFTTVVEPEEEGSAICYRDPIQIRVLVPPVHRVRVVTATRK
jgi:hypothetical protein